MKTTPQGLFPAPSASLNCRGMLLDLSVPRILGILNLTPDSFSDGGKFLQPDAALRQAEQLINDGANLLDLGAASSRPGSETISVEQELERLLPALRKIRQTFPQALLSVDTWRAEVARVALAEGVHIVNDISAGRWEPDILNVAAAHGAPYILMHMQGTPATMQQNPTYTDVVAEVEAEFIARLNAARAAGIVDVVLDPGFGFGKTLAHNYALFSALERFTQLGCPVLVGISRKRMVSQLFSNESPENLTPAYTALHLQALQAGVRLLRVHEPRWAVQAIAVWQQLAAHSAV
jgi:dihydropteroate synthase